MPADAPPRRGPNREPVRVGGAATAYSVIDYPDEIAAATAQLSTNAAGFNRVTIRPLLTAEEMGCQCN
jgi:hypothetical protein